MPHSAAFLFPRGTARAWHQILHSVQHLPPLRSPRKPAHALFRRGRYLDDCRDLGYDSCAAADAINVRRHFPRQPHRGRSE
jgi:hypothetical protein